MSTPEDRIINGTSSHLDALVVGSRLGEDLLYWRNRAEAAEEGLRTIASAPVVERNPDGVDQAAYSMQLIAEGYLATVDGTATEAEAGT